MIAGSALAGIGVALLWGFTSVLESLVAPKNRALVLVAWDAIWGILIVGLLSLLGVQWWDVSAEVWFWTIGGGTFRIVAWVVYWKIMSDKTSSLALAISATYSLPTVLMMAALGQPLQWMVLAATLTIFLGVLWSGARQKLSGNNLWWALLCCVLWGGWSVCQWKAAKITQPQDLLAVSWIVNIVPSALIGLGLRLRGISLHISRRTAGTLLGAVSLGLLSTLLFYWGMKGGNAAQVVVLSSMYPLITLAVRVGMKKEVWSGRVAGGVAMLVAGAAMASLA